MGFPVKSVKFPIVSPLLCRYILRVGLCAFPDVFSLSELVQHPLFVFDLIPQAAELLLMSLPVVLQLLLQRFLKT